MAATPDARPQRLARADGAGIKKATRSGGLFLPYFLACSRAANFFISRPLRRAALFL